jgi:hypothetical protein
MFALLVEHFAVRQDDGEFAVGDLRHQPLQLPRQKRRAAFGLRL